jgi:hypothetical protein
MPILCQNNISKNWKILIMFELSCISVIALAFSLIALILVHSNRFFGLQIPDMEADEDHDELEIQDLAADITDFSSLSPSDLEKARVSRDSLSSAATFLQLDDEEVNETAFALSISFSDFVFFFEFCSEQKQKKCRSLILLEQRRKALESK